MYLRVPVSSFLKWNRICFLNTFPRMDKNVNLVVLIDIVAMISIGRMYVSRFATIANCDSHACILYEKFQGPLERQFPTSSRNPK